MRDNNAVPREQTETKTVRDEYGGKHRLHINTETNGTHLKHSEESDQHCPYCNPERDYGMGVDLS